MTSDLKMETLYRFSDFEKINLEGYDAIISIYDEMMKYVRKHGKDEKFQKSRERIHKLTKVIEAFTFLISYCKLLHEQNKKLKNTNKRLNILTIAHTDEISIVKKILHEQNDTIFKLKKEK